MLELRRLPCRDVDADDDHQWESNWRGASASSSEDDTDSPPTQETTGTRPKRCKRSTVREDEELVSPSGAVQIWTLHISFEFVFFSRMLQFLSGSTLFTDF